MRFSVLSVLKWVIRGVLALLALAFFHYTLPQTDVVRVIGTETRRMDFGANAWFWASSDAGTAATGTRDVKFIETVLYPSGEVMIYRNEDTGWSWPPFLKFDSFNLQAEATNLISTEAAPRWVVVTHYGWRNEFITIFPNALSLRVTDNPDALRLPWVNLALLALLAALAIWLRVLWRRFRLRRIQPVLDEVEDVVEAVDARADAARDRAVGLWGRFRRALGF